MPTPKNDTERLAIEQSRRRRTERRTAATNQNNVALQAENRALKWEMEALLLRIAGDELSFPKLDIAERRLALIAEVAGAKLNGASISMDRKAKPLR